MTPSTPNGLLVAITEQRTRADIDRLADTSSRDAVAAERSRHPSHGGGSMSATADPTADDEQHRRRRRHADDLRAFAKPGRRAFTPAGARRARAPLDELLPARSCAAEQGPRLPEVAEPEIVRHYNRLSKRNFDLDTGFYPLGSCTMKHNPKLHERVAALPGHAKLHPLQDPSATPRGRWS